ncbi:MAG: C40 family peptidase [Firmicutes bacterium]|nr:C40 family peptidase [Bacillota bacterium]
MGITRKQIVSLILAVAVCFAMVPQQTMAKSKSGKGFSGKSLSSASAEKLIKVAKSKRGCPYSYGAAGPGRFDCSGFVAYCMKKAGVKFSRGTAASYNKRGYNVGRNIKKAQRGDIILYSYGGGIIHCGIYLGNRKVIHAISRGVSITSYNGFGQRVAGIVRTFNKPDTAMKIKVTDKRGIKVAGTKYKIVGKKFKKTVRVNRKGYVTVKNLKAGRYKVTPVSVNKKYRAKFVKKIKIKSGKTSTVKFKNIYSKTKKLIAKAKAKAIAIAKAKAEAEAKAAAQAAEAQATEAQ